MNQIYLAIDVVQSGPFTLDQIRSSVAEGKITKEMPAWHEGLTEWVTIAQILDRASSSAPKVAPAMPPIPGQGSGPAKKKISGCLLIGIILAAVLIIISLVTGLPFCTHLEG